MGEVLDVREAYVTMERENSNELNVRIGWEEVKRCVKGQETGKAAGLDDIPYEFYKTGEKND